jgi:acyl-CoA synthetase (AMP-forming)/AMP-acid ligase II
MNLKDLLKGQPLPVLSFLDGAKDEYLSAANIYTMILEQLKSWRRSSVKPGDSVQLYISDKASMVRFLAAIVCDQTVILTANADHDMSLTPPQARPGLWVRSSGTECGRWVFLSWQQISDQVDAHAQKLASTSDYVRLSLLPKNHVFGLIIDFLVGLQLRQVILVSFKEFTHETLRAALRFVEPNDNTFMCLTPRLLAILIKNKDFFAHLSRTHVLVGGAPTPDWVREQALDVLGSLTEGYGLTEAGPGVLFDGRPLSFIKLKLIPLSESPQDKHFELCIHSPTLGIFQRNDDEWINGFYRTKDIVEVQADGTYKIVGRISERIKNLAGRWVSATDLESDLNMNFPESCLTVALHKGVLTVVVPNESAHQVPAIVSHLERRIGQKVAVVISKPEDTVSIKTKDLRMALETAGKPYVSLAS